MTTETRGDLTIIRHDATDGMVSVYRDNHHLGVIFSMLGFKAVPSDDTRASMHHPDEASAIAYLTDQLHHKDRRD